ncbi:MAG: hypothetical protein ABIR04_07655, partial [Cypionkella sp.]
MIGELTLAERWIGMLVLLALAICGVFFAAAGRSDPLGGQGWILLLAAMAGLIWMVRHYDDPAPDADRLSHY